MASSIQHIQALVKTEEQHQVSIQTLFNAEGEHQNNMQTLFQTEDEMGSGPFRPSSISIKHDKSHGSAEKASHFVHFGGVSVEGIASGIIAHALSNSENIDPRLGSASTALSIQSAAGFGRTKVGKRKSSRGSSKVPIKVFSADSSNFMAMVHKLTGLQSTPYLLPGSPQMPLLKPLLARPLHPIMQGMYTLEATAFPAGDGVTASMSDDGFSSALSQLKSLGQSQQIDSFNNVSLVTKEGSYTAGGQSSADRFPRSFHNPAFKALHPQHGR